MKKRIVKLLVCLSVLTAALTAAAVAAVCLNADRVSLAGRIILVCAAVTAVTIGTGLALLKRIIKPLSPDDGVRPDYSELAPLFRKMDEQKKQLRENRAALDDRERKLAAITENMTEGLVLMDGAGAILLMNRAAARMLGIAGEDAVGKHIFAVSRDDMLRAAVHGSLGGGANRELLDFGDMRIQAIANPVIVDGAVHGAVLMLLDVTERTRSEQMRREFSANVSHELKTPMTSISGYAEMLMQGMARPGDIPEISGRIYSEAQRLIALIDDIIKLSRLDEGSVDSPRETVDLLAEARKCAGLLEAKAARYGVSVSVGGEGASVWGSVQLIDEMIGNLCDNAIKYNRPGGHVRVAAGTRGGVPILMVSDNGIGIAPEHMERIFERFYRVDKSHSKETGGTGLGLSIVKHAAAWHKATVEAESVPDKGTRISIIFDGKGGE